jgi:hypothetical protein
MYLSFLVEAAMEEKGNGRCEEEELDPFENYYLDEDLFYWMDRDEEKDLEPLCYLGTYFPSGCRFCI